MDGFIENQANQAMRGESCYVQGVHQVVVSHLVYMELRHLQKMQQTIFGRELESIIER